MNFTVAGSGPFRPEGLPEEQDLFLEWDLTEDARNRY